MLPNRVLHFFYLSEFVATMIMMYAAPSLKADALMPLCL
jgi:hypothetical protein